ncbi:hypothetical protein SLA2020_267600 [Shorea laevis]
MTKDKQPRILFLMETKICKFRMEYVRNKLGFEGMFTVDPIGLSGGIALLWKEAREVEIQNFSNHHINAFISIGASANKWLLTGFYGDPNRAHRLILGNF